MNTEEINVERTVKKETIRWFVPAAWGLICLALLALARLQVQGMLVDYQTKEKAEEERKVIDARFDSMQIQIAGYSKQVADLYDKLNGMDKKLDHLQFALDYAHDQNVILKSPKAKDTNP